MFDGSSSAGRDGGVWRLAVGVVGAVAIHAVAAGFLLTGSTVVHKTPRDLVPVVFVTPSLPRPVSGVSSAVVPSVPRRTRKPAQRRLDPPAAPPRAIAAPVEPEREAQPATESVPEPDHEVLGAAGGELGGEPAGESAGRPGGSGGAPMRLQRRVTPPKALASTMREPAYSRMLRAAGVTGRVLLMVEVRRDGTVGEVKVRSGSAALAAAAIEAIRTWRFTPAKFEGHPVAVWLPYPFVFRLE